MIKIETPISEKVIRNLKVGDEVYLNGRVITARDVAHKYMVEEKPDFLKNILEESVIYHCGPVVKKENGVWKIVAAGPTTSAREEPYQATVIDHYTVRGVIGKGGMGEKTLAGLGKTGAVYFHAIGGLAVVLAESIKRVVNVHKLEEFGAPEAFWELEVEDLPVIVTMDSH
ncbi:FumA C-terminus/TtdB family hydratase beta subunit, partial [bacterium]|nr:FumA C-terminus/TtdB family hydratase beta subunit [bacterium]